MLLQSNEGDESPSGYENVINALEGRSNMNEAILRNSWRPNGKNVIFTYDKNGHIIKTGGIYKDVLDILQTTMNCLIASGSPKDFSSGYGKALKNGTWTGVIGRLIEGQFDLFSGLMTSHERQKVLDFSWKINQRKICLMSSKSSASKLDVWAYATIFPITAWVTGLALLVVAALCFFVSSNESITKAITLMGRLFLQTSYDIQTNGIASKSLLIIAAVCLNLVFIYFCSDMTAKMTSEPRSPNIHSFEDVESQGYQLIIKEGDGRMPASLLRTAPPGSAMRRMYDEGNYLKMDEEEMLTTVMNDHKALLWAIVVDDKYDLAILDIIENVATDKGLAFKKDSELTRSFNFNLLKMQESGLINRITNKWTGRRDLIYGLSEPLVLTFNNLFFPFGGLALGILIAIPITLVEMIVGKYKASRRNNHSTM